MISTLIYTAALLWAALKAELAVRNMQHKFAVESKMPVYTDEDSYWINGMFYYNPHDGKTLVSNRVGMGMTINMAKPLGKIFIAFSLLCILVMPFLSAWFVAEEFTPLNVKVLDSEIVITHLWETARIPVAEIEEIKLLADLPRVRRIAGTGLDNLLKGTFEVEGCGRGKLYLNPQEPPFILIKTQQGYVVINMYQEVLDLK